MNMLSGVIIVIGLVGGIIWGYQLIFGRCPYCGSKDKVPDDGAFFYCNNCRRKW